MKLCNKCKTAINDGDERILHLELICEDCYIDAHMPKMLKALYNKDSDFMQRLQTSYSVRKQQFY